MRKIGTGIPYEQDYPLNVITHILFSFINAKPQLDHAVDPLGVHSRFLDNATLSKGQYCIIQCEVEINHQVSTEEEKFMDSHLGYKPTSSAKPEERSAVSKSSMTRSLTDLSPLSASTRCLRFSTKDREFIERNIHFVWVFGENRWRCRNPRSYQCCGLG